MNKWIAIPVISVLAVALAGGGYFLWQQTTKLGDAEAEIVALEGNVSTLEGNVATLEGSVSTLEADLAASETEASALEADLESANSQIGNLQADVSTQRTINSTLSAELKKVQDPKFFESLSELADWLQQDDTDTRYADENVTLISHILQVRALRDGYLLPADVDVEGDVNYWGNFALIGDKIYLVEAWNDGVSVWATNWDILPSHPLPLD